MDGCKGRFHKNYRCLWQIRWRSCLARYLTHSSLGEGREFYPALSVIFESAQKKNLYVKICMKNPCFAHVFNTISGTIRYLRLILLQVGNN